MLIVYRTHTTDRFALSTGPSIPTTDDVTPFHPETPATTKFLRHGYYAAVSFMDEQVGRLVDRVEELGKTGETIVIFHGDHVSV
jgi:iduronate 2-sulfatase